MRRATRRKSWFRWGLTGAVALLTAAILAGTIGLFEIDVIARSGGGYVYVGTGHGSLYVGGQSLDHRFRPRFISYRFPWTWWPLWTYRYAPMSGGHMVNSAWNFRLTLWPYWVLLAIPTLRIWYVHFRRIEPGHCRCGYDLTGCASAKCPECGRETSPSSAS